MNVMAMLVACAKGQACDRADKITMHDTTQAPASGGGNYYGHMPAPSDDGIEGAVPLADGSMIAAEWD